MYGRWERSEIGEREENGIEGREDEGKGKGNEGGKRSGPTPGGVRSPSPIKGSYHSCTSKKFWHLAHGFATRDTWGKTTLNPYTCSLTFEPLERIPQILTVHQL